MFSFDLQIPFFVPVWRRVVLLSVCFGWGLYEAATGAPIWAMIFCGMGALAAWQLFFDGWPDSDDSSSESSNDSSSK